ncbi:MAG: heavy metal translocating P-type ATPase [Clostridia bacterium]|nr:heavy metal translocating P-type ATPase [Clostridia bacterium]
MKRYRVTGMSCAACSARVERAVSSVPGVTACTVNLLTGMMQVEGNAGDEAVHKAVADAGYGIAGMDDRTRTEREDRETPGMVRRLILSACFLLPLMYLSMGHTMYGWPVPPVLAGHPFRIALCEAVLALTVMIINRRFFISGIRGVLRGAPNMDTLVATGSGASFLYSLFVMLTHEETEIAHGLYFESAAMILALVTVGKTLESLSKGRTTDALKHLMMLAPDTATLIRDGKEITVPTEQVAAGDVFVLRAGDRVPVDGTVTEGACTADEAALTGESLPAEKVPGDEVNAGTTVSSGYARCRAVRVGTDTTLSGIIRLVDEASSTKAPAARTADRAAGVFVPCVMAVSLITMTVWLLTGSGIETALTHAAAVLVISCPCALGLATPVAIMVGMGVGAKHGILYKTAAALEMSGRTEIAALDKTGTVTEGRAEVTDVLPGEGVSREELLTYACAAENGSGHPLARAITRFAAENGIFPEEQPVGRHETVTGNGLRASVNGRTVTAGSEAFVSRGTAFTEAMHEACERFARDGKTPVCFADEKRLLGIIAIADRIRDDSPRAIGEMKNLGIRTVMLTGDRKTTAGAVGVKAGTDETLAELLPAGKAEHVRKLRVKGRVMMIGDGINDAPALTGADVGVAIGAGTDVAIDAADVILMNDSLSDAAASVRLGRAVLRNIRQNLFWALGYNLIAIPLAAGILTPLTGWTMTPMLGAAAMSCSSVAVVLNALRLNRFDPYSAAKDRPVRQTARKLYTYRIGVDGMMCPHCERTVREALEKLNGALQAEADHEAGTAVLISEKKIPAKQIREVIEREDYGVTDVVREV